MRCVIHPSGISRAANGYDFQPRLSILSRTRRGVMPTRPPILDNRALQDSLQRLQELASTDVREWTPPRDGDAGTMLQRIFARLLELALQRLNQVPEKNLRAFLNTMGVSLLPPSPAQVPL